MEQGLSRPTMARPAILEAGRPVNPKSATMLALRCLRREDWID
jgi:hypothetical protein